MAAYAQFGYSYPAAGQLLVSGSQTTTTGASAQSPLSGANAPSISPSVASATGAPTGALSPGAISQTSNAAAGSGSCCENGRPIMTDPVSGQTVCSCQYDSARLALSSYSRIPTGSVGVYGTPYPSTEQNPYPSIGVDSSAFYSPLSNPYTLKESGPSSDMTAWTSAGLQPTTGYYPYDPTLAAYGYGAGYDLAARRKNATRESTATLKAWLNEHKKNPYPTKGEKIMLAIITKMTLTQVSTWFANARRRLKKENKMTWEPKNKTDDDDDAMVSDDEKDKDDIDSDKHRDHKDSLHHVKSEHDKDDDDEDLTDDDRKPNSVGIMGLHGNNHMSHQHPAYQHHHNAMLSGYTGIKDELSGSKNQQSSDCGVPIPATKPKIWSLADTAACKTPPPSAYLGQHLQHLHHQQQQQEQHSWMENYQAQQSHHQSHQHHHQQQQSQQQSTNLHQNGGDDHRMMNMEEAMTNMVGMSQHQGQMQSAHGPALTSQVPQHHQQPQTQPQMNSMSNFRTTSPYSRGYGGFLEDQMQHQMYPTQHQSTPITPTTGMPHHQISNQHSPNQMGFSEVQTDTPPQTPPNMKIPSVAGPLITDSVTPTIGTCYNGSGSNSSAASISLSSSPSSNSSYGSYSGVHHQNPEDDYTQHMHNSSQQDSSGTQAFKPFFKSQQISAGFVSPV